MGPGTLGLAANQINIFVNTWLATSQGEGAVSWLNYAFRLMHFPIGIFGVAIATAALPTFSSHVSRRETEELRETLLSSLRMVFLLNVPASSGLIFLSTHHLSIVMGALTLPIPVPQPNALIFYSISLPAHSAVKPWFGLHARHPEFRITALPQSVQHRAESESGRSSVPRTVLGTINLHFPNTALVAPKYTGSLRHFQL
jgi:hypothetical protein